MNNNKAYILNQKIDKEFNAAGKAMRDVFEVFTSKGVKIMPGMPKDSAKLLKILDIPILIFYCIFVLKKDDYVIFSYPENHLKIKLLKKIAPIRKIKVVCFINDINSIREGRFDDPDVKQKIREDMELIGSASIIIAPNNNSKEFLKSQGINSQIICVGTWDYILKDGFDLRCMIHKNDEPWKIAFAGNLDKAPFINMLSEYESDNLQFKLWGNSKNVMDFSSNCDYMGSVAPEVLPYMVCECNFGLVWDGTGIHECIGGLGEYLKYNNSHKCGLYLACGLPVFVWKQAGLADFVKENGCGFVIDSLDDIAPILNSMTNEEYEKLISNVNTVAVNIREGYYLQTALEEMFHL